MERFIKPADRLGEYDKNTQPMWLTAIYVALIVLAFGAAGRVDEEEAQRLSFEGYIQAHATVDMSAADGACR